MDINVPSPRTVGELAAWLRSLPDGTSLPARGVADYLERLHAEPPWPAPPSVQAQPLPWAALLWVVPPETRIGVRELAEATGRPKSWVYRHTSGRGDCPRLPHRKLDGELVFVVGEVRRWLLEHEVVIAPCRAANAPTDASVGGFGLHSGINDGSLRAP
jgi:predicted DNA-binding transcriptional regulator AlpA